MEREKITFSMIIPCYNTPERYMTRLLDSITPENQGINKDQLEVIIVDDCSTDKSFLDICKSYEDRINFVYVETDPEYHTGYPSYPRNVGLDYVTKDWLCFCDHDDMYEKDALSIVEKHIVEFNTPYAICGNMRSWNEEKDKYTDFIHRQAWLHGKLYSMKHLIKPYNIKFFNIKTHEDIGFNCIIQSIMYELNTDFDYIDAFLYRWLEEPTSITRSYNDDHKISDDIIRGYLHDNFNDYIIAGAYAFFDRAKSGNWWFVNQIIMTLLHCYFYYMGAIFRHGEELYEDNLEDIRNFYNKIIDEIGINAIDIIKFVASDERKYQLVRNDCIMHEGCFMEYVSFPDFVLYLDEEYKKRLENKA